jgi:hypothetical protein
MVKIDLGRIARQAAVSPERLVHPRDIFDALPARPEDYDYLRGPQDQVLEKWHKRRNSPDLVLKMNTGGGKTLVGLLIALSCLNEGAGPVSYLVPDHYLAEQVRSEAARLGIETTDDPRALSYSSGRAILVDVFQRLFNGLSIFGVRGSVGKPQDVPLGTVIIDDAHACLAKAEQAFRLTVTADEPEYEEILELFADAIGGQSPSGLMDLRAKRTSAVQQVPHWAWADRQDCVLAMLHPLGTRGSHIFEWPLLVDVLPICRAVFTADSLEIAAPCLPAATISGFQSAQRRVYLTATLADDGVLVTDFGTDPEAVKSPIVPANAGDIGDRLILIPQETHPEASSEDIRQLVVDLAHERNVVVIVPSRARARYWQDDAALVLDKTNLGEGVAQLRGNAQLGLVVLINRYDGVDLPGDACHVLVIDGLPEALDGLERLDQSQLSGSDLLTARQIQRLEQGMGRATRSNTDHCVVLLVGARLAQRLHGTTARDCFSPATRAQLDLSSAIANELSDAPFQSLRDVIDQCLSRDKDWIAANRKVLASLRYGPATVIPSAIAGRQAFDLATAQEYREASSVLQLAVNEVTDPVLKGYMQQQLSAYLHHVDPPTAQKLQRAANRINRNVLRPISGVGYEKISAPALTQGAAAASWLQTQYATSTDLVVGFSALIADLTWGPRTKLFEQAWCDLAWHLGVAGQRPERDTGRGPDGLWALAETRFLVCEAKSGAKDSHPVYKSDAEQLSNSMDWFRGEYPGWSGTPVLIHPSAKFDRKAAVPTGCRVITKEKLDSLGLTLTRFCSALADTDAFRTPARVAALLHSHGLTSDLLLARHSVGAIRGG